MKNREQELLECINKNKLETIVVKKFIENNLVTLINATAIYRHQIKLEEEGQTELPFLLKEQTL